MILKTVEAFMESVKRSMVSNRNVYLRGFGTLSGRLKILLKTLSLGLNGLRKR